MSRRPRTPGWHPHGLDPWQHNAAVARGKARRREYKAWKREQAARQALRYYRLAPGEHVLSRALVDLVAHSFRRVARASITAADALRRLPPDIDRG